VKIYTRRGDNGSTGLFGGGRTSKDDVRVEAYGTVDELNAVIGGALGHVTDQAIVRRLRHVQSDLFAIGAHLRAERRVVTLASSADVAPDIVRYLNRLSDYLFAAARQENTAAGGLDIEWRA